MRVVKEASYWKNRHRIQPGAMAAVPFGGAKADKKGALVRPTTFKAQHQMRKFPIPFKQQIRPLLVRLRYHGLRHNDVVIGSYPRSGSTWLRFILFEILSGKEASFESVNRAIPYVGWHREASPLLPDGGRLMQSHERFTSGVHKAVYIVRDVRSVVLSEYRLSRMYGYTNDFSHFLSDFVAGRANAFGSSWNQHVNSWLDSPLAQSHRLLLVKYEDMRRDTDGSLARVLDFLGITADSRDVSAAIRSNDVSRMRSKENQAPARELHKVDSSIPFIGEGSISEWKIELDDEYTRTVEKAAASAMSRLSYEMNGRVVERGPMA